jgi:hypothetical protein
MRQPATVTKQRSNSAFKSTILHRLYRPLYRSEPRRKHGRGTYAALLQLTAVRWDSIGSDADNTTHVALHSFGLAEG